MTIKNEQNDAAAKKLHLKIVADDTDYEELRVAPQPLPPRRPAPA